MADGPPQNPLPSRNPLIPAREVDPKQDLPAMERQVLERWRKDDVFAQSLRIREGAEPFVFYEGPPTANAGPGSHHVLARVFKDIFPRYKTMRGFYVERKGGWDCHGLPVEIAVERKLGFTQKSDIERYGIAEFNRQCSESVVGFLEEWNELTERIGYWVDLEHPYRTMDPTYIESVWWALRRLWDMQALYEGFKVVPYCPKDGTALSSHEVAQGYQNVIDRSVYVRLPVLSASGPVQAGDALLIWTTTPWTLPGNVAVAVAPEVEYVRARDDGQTLILAGALVERVLGEGTEILDRFPGSELVGAHYQGPIFALDDREPGGYPIVAGDFVTTEDGTGLVHIAPAFGEDDFAAAASAANVAFDPTDPSTLYNPVKPDGTYDARVRSHEGGSYEGRHVKDPEVTDELIEDLRARGLLFREEPYEHSYPHCWRCGTPLIYYAKTSWYIRTTAARDRLLAANETIDWHPEHIKHGRFGDWLRHNVDWAISRERYWGTPLPVWRNAAGETVCIGSFAELAELSGVTLEDPHRPYVDDVEIPSPTGGEPLRRVPEVIDVWFDSGAMPFAQRHYPFEPHSEAHFAERFPADYICEAIDQTRGWFYSLLAISTLLFDRSSYRTVLCLGHIADLQGKKMSKSLGNTVVPWEVIDRHGADAFRWYYLTSKQPWDGYLFSIDTVGEAVRQFLLQLWSTYYFYVLYATVNEGVLDDATRDRTRADGTTADEGTGDEGTGGEGTGGEGTGGEDDLDRWARSRTASTAEVVAERLDAYDATTAGRAIAELVDDLSNWYVRRSRRRFWDGDPAAFDTLRTCLVTVAQLLAPFCPFIADEIYDNLDGTLVSVHLCDFPTGEALPARDRELEQAMALARETVRLGLGARGKAKLKVRQPLGEAVVVADGRERAAIERLAEVVREELNVRRVRFVAAAEELSEYEVKANYRTLGPLFGKDMPQAAEAIAAIDPARVAAAIRGGNGEIGIAVAGREHTLSAEDVILKMRAPEGYSVEREGAHAVALDLTLDEDLRGEGYAREIVHAVQNARKAAGLLVEDRIELWLAGEPALIEAAQAHRDYLTGETLAVELSLDGENPNSCYSEQAEVDGLALSVALRRAKGLGP
jgi:isoleucyl-tRNA synthetase